MTKINGRTYEDAVDVSDSDRGLGSTASLRRMVEAGERRFWRKRGGVPSPWTMREDIKASSTDGKHRKKKREEEANEQLRIHRQLK